MIKLVYLLLGPSYFSDRWRSLFITGLLWAVVGVLLFIDGLDNALYFPIQAFAVLVAIDGLATVAVAFTGIAGQRQLRLVKGAAALLTASLLFMAGAAHGGEFVLSMAFGLLFLADGVLQCGSAWLVRHKRWRGVMAGGVLQILIAVFFFQPYPSHYQGTVPYALGLFLLIGGCKLMILARHARAQGVDALHPDRHAAVGNRRREFDGPPTADEPALTVHVWTPGGSARSPTLNRPVVDRYIVAVDASGAISTGHAALQTPEGIYISLYPGVEIDRSPDEFTRVLRATDENDGPGVFQPDYDTESKAWCPSTVQVRIRSYDAARLADFWADYRQNPTYNLTRRNCSSSVSAALEAALHGVVGANGGRGWGALVRLLLTPELWVAGQLRKRALTMAWTPGLTLDYARALSMLADPRRLNWRRLWTRP